MGLSVVAHVGEGGGGRRPAPIHACVCRLQRRPACARGGDLRHICEVRPESDHRGHRRRAALYWPREPGPGPSSILLLLSRPAAESRALFEKGPAAAAAAAAKTERRTITLRRRPARCESERAGTGAGRARERTRERRELAAIVFVFLRGDNNLSCCCRARRLSRSQAG